MPVCQNLDKKDDATEFRKQFNLFVLIQHIHIGHIEMI